MIFKDLNVDLLENKLEKFSIWVEKKGIICKRDFALSKISQIKCGGTPSHLLYPKNLSELQDLIQYLAKHQIPKLIVGNLSNLLIRDGKILTVVICLKNMRTVSFSQYDVTVDAGLLIPAFARLMENKGYRGFSGMYGVPGNIGGAIFMNASCYGDECSLYLKEVLCLDELGQLCNIIKKDLRFDWRYSAFHDEFKDYTIVKARFSLIKNNNNIDGNLKSSKVEINRRTYQETTYPNLGSLFATTDIYGDLAKNFFYFRILYAFVRILVKVFPGNRHHHVAKLSSLSARALFGLKNETTVGLSEKTINCVVNFGTAKSDDIIKLIRKIQRQTFNSLPLEIEILEDIN